MLSLHSYLLYCGVYAIAIAVPGPGVVAIVARALGSGFRATVPAVIGTAVGDLVMLSLSVFGLALVAQAMGGLFLIVKLAGAAYLVYLGYKYWTAPVADMETIIPSGSRQSFLSQFALILGNPKTIAFFVALLPTVIDLNHLNVFGYLQLGATTCILIPAIMLSYAALASHVRGFLASRKARGRLNKGAAVIMVGAGVGVAVS
ncbi:MAG: LysE family translocator [Rhizomicrobium sp.]|jgi:threonine/homoserine/homoserine lactone efflux protein